MGAGHAEPYPRTASTGRPMVSGLVSWSLHQAVKDFAAAKKLPAYKVYQDIGIGNSTQDRMAACRRIAQTTALKILKHLGTDVRTVLTKYQHKETK